MNSTQTLPLPLLLIIDDEPTIRESLEALLAHEGYRLELAQDGPQGLAAALSLRPDVILLDVMMPGMDGYEVCRRLRADPLLNEVPIIMVTALDDRASRLQGLEAGADDFLSKPIDRLELRARLRTVTRLDRFRKLYTERGRLELALRQLETSHLALQRAYDETIAGWARALDYRDHETEGHSQRVRDLTIGLARWMGFPESDILHIGRGALLHDMGKLAIPDEILLKPGPLTEAEWAIMKQHPTYAYEMLYPIEYLRPALEIPYCHHEKWDGGDASGSPGYPRGLRGEQIPLSARVFAIVDVWDAILSDRPYHKARTSEYAIHYLRTQVGRHFDPAVVAAFQAFQGLKIL
jgi:putative two-component system response regulator